MRSVPEILLITEILCKVNLLLSLPAMSTLNVSAAIFSRRQTVKMIMRSWNVYLIAKLVAVASQKMNTFGFKVFIRNPDEKIFAMSLFRNRTVGSSGVP